MYYESYHGIDGYYINPQEIIDPRVFRAVVEEVLWEIVLDICFRFSLISSTILGLLVVARLLQEHFGL